jgi:hypothetical protein
VEESLGAIPILTSKFGSIGYTLRRRRGIGGLRGGPIRRRGVGGEIALPSLFRPRTFRSEAAAYRQSAGGCHTLWPTGPERSTGDHAALGSSADSSGPPCAITGHVGHVAIVCMILSVYCKTLVLGPTTRNARAGSQSTIHPKLTGCRWARANYRTHGPRWVDRHISAVHKAPSGVLK